MNPRIKKELLFRIKTGKGKGKKVYTIDDYVSDLYKTLSFLGENNYSSIVDCFYNSKSRASECFNKQLFPEKWEELCLNMQVVLKNSENKYLFWYAELIEKHSKEINIYLQSRDKYEKAFICGNYDNAERILDEMELKLGVSFWSLDCRLALKEYSEGLKGNKEYLDLILDKKCNEFVKAMAYYFSFKNETRISNNQYCHGIEIFLDNLHDDLKSIYKSFLYPVFMLDYSEIGNVLAYSSSFSMIDIYNSFVKICTRVISEENKSHFLYKYLVKALKKISSVNDIVICKIKYFLGISAIVKSDFDNEFMKLSDLYSIGRYDDVINSIDAILPKYGNCLELYELYVKSYIMYNKDFDCYSKSIKDELLYSLYGCYIKNNSFEKSQYTLYKLLRLFSDSHFGSAISSFCCDKFFFGDKKIPTYIKEITSMINNIKTVIVLSDNTNDYLEFFYDLYPDSPTVALFSSLYSNIKNSVYHMVEPNRIRWYEIKKMIFTKDFRCINLLIIWYNELVNIDSSYSSYQKERLSTELFYLYINTNNKIEAERILVDEYLRNRYSILRMDKKSLSIDNSIDKEIKKDICTPIVSCMTDNMDYQQMYKHAVNFLDAVNIEKPSFLLKNEELIEKIGKEKVIYFLKNVCLIEILCQMICFDSPLESIDERRCGVHVRTPWFKSICKGGC